MQEIIIGVAILLGLVGLQTGLRYWTVHRTRHAWNDAQAHLSRGDYDDAEVALARCVKLMPLWLQPRSLYGGLLAQQGKLESAEEQLKMVAELQPKESEGHIELGIFYVTATERIEDGLTAFRDALACDAQARHRLETEPRLRAFRKGDAYGKLKG